MGTTSTITIERVINAPIERVFDAWITPEDLVRWYSPGNGWTTPHAEVDAVPGGAFTIAFHNPEGEHSFDFEGTYTEVDRPHHIAYLIADGRPVTIDFSEENGATKVTLVFTMENENSEELQRAGWGAQVEGLAAYLEK